jgi:uncharacterized protein YgbK (DUF1537 family)
VIAVVADDFTGAAEIGAIGLRYGLTAEVQTSFRDPAGVDIVVIDTDSRSSTEEEAVSKVSEEIDRLRAGRVEWIYKKVDSVLRGHVVAELAAMMPKLRMERALLIPNNPSYGQTIRDGRYAIDGRPLDETRFRSDPEYPAATAEVLDLLGGAGVHRLAWCEGSDGLPEGGIAVGGAESTGDLEAWARRLDGRTLAAGAAEFFAAALRVRLGRPDGRASVANREAPPRRALFVLGSTSDSSRAILAQAVSAGVPVVTIPVELLDDAGAESAMAPWVEAAVEGLTRRGRTVVTFARSAPDGRTRVPPRALPGRLAALVRAVVRRQRDPGLHLFVEGGTTVSMLVRRLGWDRFSVTSEEGNGVATLGVADDLEQRLTVKPGGYAWPAAVLRWLQ